MVVGPTTTGRAPRLLAPRKESHFQTSASRRYEEAPEAATGRRAFGQPTYEHPQRYLIVGLAAKVVVAEADRGGFVVDDGCADIDWAKDDHAACVLDGVGVSIEQRCFVHDERGLAELCTTLRRHGVRRVAIERPEGVLVERLLEAGLLTVMAVHPNQLEAARPRFRASGGKSDAFDALCLAELASTTDHHRFRALVPDSDQTKAIRVLTQRSYREDLVGERVAVANRLRAELEAFWPAPTFLFSATWIRPSPWRSWSDTRAPGMRAGFGRTVAAGRSWGVVRTAEAIAWIALHELHGLAVRLGLRVSVEHALPASKSRSRKAKQSP